MRSPGPAQAAEELRVELEAGGSFYLEAVRAANHTLASEGHKDRVLQTDAGELESHLTELDQRGLMPLDSIAEAVFEALGIGPEEDDAASALVEETPAWDLHAAGQWAQYGFRLWTLRDQPAFGVVVLWDEEVDQVATASVAAPTC